MANTVGIETYIIQIDDSKLYEKLLKNGTINCK